MIEVLSIIGMFFLGMIVGILLVEVGKFRTKRFPEPREDLQESLPGCTTVSVTYQIVSEVKKEEP